MQLPKMQENPQSSKCYSFGLKMQENPKVWAFSRLLSKMLKIDTYGPLIALVNKYRCGLKMGKNPQIRNHDCSGLEIPENTEAWMLYSCCLNMRENSFICSKL